MTDKSAPTRQQTLLRLEDKVTDLLAAIGAADFLIQKTVIEGGTTGGDKDRVVIEMSEGEFSALSYMASVLYREAKDFKDAFYTEWHNGGAKPQKEGKTDEQ